MEFDVEAVTREAKHAWATSPTLRAEFASEDEYLAYRRAEARGQVRIHTSTGVVTGTPPAPITDESYLRGTRSMHS